jgi:hypothetical protein
MKIISEEVKVQGQYYVYKIAKLSDGKNEYDYEIIKNQKCI